MNVYSDLKKLAKSIRMQNLFSASKELHCISLFNNISDFSRIQEIFLSYLYRYNNIHHDIVVDKISKHVIDCEIYEDAYILWKSKSESKSEKKEDNLKQQKVKDLHLVCGKTIFFKNEK